MGKGSKTTTTSNQTQTQNQQGQNSTTIDPVIQGQVYKNIEAANQTAAGYTPATIGGPAGFTADQLAAFEAARKIGGAGQGTLQTGIDAATAAAGYTPDRIGASTYAPSMMTGKTGYDAATFNGPTNYQAEGYKAATAASQGYDAALAEGAQGYQAQQAQAAQINRGNVRDINATSTVDKLPSYLKSFDTSYQQNVIDQALKDLDRSRVMTMQGSDAAAARAGAWGSRRDILDAETNRGFADAAARTSADLRNQGFQTALGALTQDQQRELAASAANQNADTSVYGANAQLQQGTNLANVDAANQASQFGAQSNNAFTLSNQQARNQAAAFGAEAANQASIENAGAANDASRYTAGARNQAAEFGLGLGAQIGMNNQAAQNTAGQFNAGQAFNQNAANQNATNTAGAFNAGQTQSAAGVNAGNALAGNAQRLAAGQTLAGMGGQQQDMAVTGANALNSVGTQQQQLDQARIDVANQNAQNAANADLMRLGIQQSGMNGAVYGSTTNSTGSSTGNSSGTQTVQTQPSLGSSIMSAVGTIGGLASSFLPGAGLMAGSAKKLPGTSTIPRGFTAGDMLPGSLTVSDERMKKNVIRIGSPLKKVKKMTGVNYDWKDGGADSGLLAQDVAKASPRAVKTIGGIKAYNPAPVLGLLVESVKELDRKVARR